MSNKAFPTDILKQAQQTLDAWKKIDPGLSLGDLNPGEIEANLNKLSPIQSRINSLKAELTDQHNQRDDVCVALWAQVKRARAGIKGVYGDNSSQYEMMGGTRLSERKPAARKAAAPASAPAKTE